MSERQGAIDGPRLPRPDELDDLHRVLAVSFGYHDESAPPRRRRSRGSAVPRESRIIAVDGKPVSHIRIVYCFISIYGVRIKAAAFGGVCTDPEYRGRGIATRLLDYCIDEATRAGAKLLIISGDRGLYLRAQAAIAGPVWETRVVRHEDGDSGQARTVRAAGLDDAPALSRLHQAEVVRYLRSGDFFARMLRHGHRQPWLIESGGQPIAYLSLSRIWGLPSGTGVRALAEYGGSRSALLDSLPSILDAAGLTELRVSFPTHDAEMTHLFRSRGVSLQHDTVHAHTYRLLDLPGLLRALRPYFAARLPAAALRAFSMTPTGERVSPAGERVNMQFGSEQADLNLSEAAAIMFGGPAAPAIDGDLGELMRRIFPIPLPLPGLNYV